MDKVLIHTQNVLLSGALIRYFRERGALEPLRVIERLRIEDIKAQEPKIILLEVTRLSGFTFDERVNLTEHIRQYSNDIKITYMCDEYGDRDIPEKVINAKKQGIIDNFFYESVSGEYIAASVEAMI